jgi:porphobilinogen synthase
MSDSGSKSHFPIQRPRRLRANPAIRNLVQENFYRPEQLVLPFFVREGKDFRQPVRSMPGVFQLSVDEFLIDLDRAWSRGVRTILLFGIPDEKDAGATGAFSPDGIVQRAVKSAKERFPQLLAITDVCLCEYMSHGHCGIIHSHSPGVIQNDSTLEILARVAVSHAEAGADLVAPSDMMDGRVRAIREALDNRGFGMTPIMSYAAKFASAFYGPFREAAESTPQFGDRKSYQMDPANALEALREVEMDIAEGADIVMVKPGLAYLDLVYRVKEKFGYPTAVYSVSGEYSMIKAAAANGWIDEKNAFLESYYAMRRAGAGIVITYAAADLVEWLKAE